MRTWLLILAGLGLSILGCLVPFMMVIRVVQTTWFLNFAAFTAMMVGLVLGLLGGTLHVRGHRPAKREW